MTAGSQSCEADMAVGKKFGDAANEPRRIANGLEGVRNEVGAAFGDAHFLG